MSDQTGRQSQDGIKPRHGYGAEFGEGMLRTHMASLEKAFEFVSYSQ